MNEESLVERAEGLVMAEDFANLLRTPDTACYSSLEAKTPQQKKILFKAISNPDMKLSDALNIKLKVTDIYCETVDIMSEATGGIEKCPRIVLIDEEGKSYQSVSFGVFNSLKRLISVFGPPSWKPALELIPKAVKTGTNQVYTLTME